MSGIGKIIRNICAGGIGAFFLVSVVVGYAGDARAVSVPLALVNAESIGPGFDVRLDLEVLNDQATFVFSNFSFGAESGTRIHEIYFETGLGSELDVNTVFSFGDPGSGSNEVSYTSAKVNPKKPPGIVPTWTSSLISFDEDSGGTGVGSTGAFGEPGSGIQSFTVIFDLVGSIGASALMAIIADDSLNSRIALHTGDCDAGESCVIAATTAIPVPAAIWFFLSGLAGLAGVGRFRKSQSV